MDMIKKTCIMAIAVMLSCHMMAQTPSTYVLTTGNVSMTIDAEHGARITSLKYGDKEVISQLRWPESFGSTFWTSPQKEWNWPPVPEYDKQPYNVREENGALIMTSNVSQRMKYRIEKKFSVDEKAHAIDITYSITNEGDEERRVAPWEITRVPNAGLIFFDAPAEAITPAGLMDFRASEGISWYQPDATNENRKINADAKGWLAYANDGVLLIKKFADLMPSEPAPDEAEVQVYVNRGKTYIELESQGAYTSLKPGETLSWAVRWIVLPCDADASPSKSLKDIVMKAI